MPPSPLPDFVYAEDQDLQTSPVKKLGEDGVLGSHSAIKGCLRPEATGNEAEAERRGEPIALNRQMLEVTARLQKLEASFGETRREQAALANDRNKVLRFALPSHAGDRSEDRQAPCSAPHSAREASTRSSPSVPKLSLPVQAERAERPWQLSARSEGRGLDELAAQESWRPKWNPAGTKWESQSQDALQYEPTFGSPRPLREGSPISVPRAPLSARTGTTPPAGGCVTSPPTGGRWNECTPPHGLGDSQSASVLFSLAEDARFAQLSGPASAPQLRVDKVMGRPRKAVSPLGTTRVSNYDPLLSPSRSMESRHAAERPAQSVTAPARPPEGTAARQQSGSRDARLQTPRTKAASVATPVAQPVGQESRGSLRAAAGPSTASASPQGALARLTSSSTLAARSATLPPTRSASGGLTQPAQAGAGSSIQSADASAAAASVGSLSERLRNTRGNTQSPIRKLSPPAGQQRVAVAQLNAQVNVVAEARGTAPRAAFTPVPAPNVVPVTPRDAPNHTRRSLGSAVPLFRCGANSLAARAATSARQDAWTRPQLSPRGPGAQ